MEKIKIDAGWVNGHDSAQRGIWRVVYEYLLNDPNTVKLGRSLGHCQSETTWDNGKVEMTWKTDCSD